MFTRACREAVWLEHRQLLAEPEDVDDIVHASRRFTRTARISNQRL